ncbi:MAG: hypothetical protein ACYC3X_28650 [Pirellulaceae bacterium]
MFRSYRHPAWVAAFGLAVGLSGCGSTAPQEKQKSTKPTESKAPEQPAGQGDHAGHEGHQDAANGGQADASSADAAKGLAELSAADRATAEKQRVCPVSGDVLGAQGQPYKVTVKGQTVFLCCQACEKQLMENPDKYLAQMQAGKPE